MFGITISIVNIFMRGSKIIGKIISGESLKDSFSEPKKQNPFGGFQNQQNSSSIEDEYTQKSSENVDDNGFTDYEDVTEE